MCVQHSDTRAAPAAARGWQAIVAEHLSVVSEMQSQHRVLDAMASELIAALQTGRRIYLLGNGGSAADAQHIAAELVGRFKHNRRALPVIALTTDTSALTAIGNDLGFEQVFLRPIEALVGPGDVVWALSTSGASQNVLTAVRAAVERGAVTIGFTGARGDPLAALCRHVLRVPHTSSDRIQEGHVLAYHYLCEQIEGAIASDRS